VVLLTLLFFAYNLYGNYFPDLIRHRGVSYLHFADIAFFTTDGVFGVPLRVAATGRPLRIAAPADAHIPSIRPTEPAVISITAGNR
jgi:hypothetical protein